MKYAILLLCIIVCCNAQCQGTPNNIPIQTQDPTLVKTTTNGKLFTVGTFEPQLSVVHLYGSPYEMGFAHGTLLKDQINTIVPQVQGYIEAQVEQNLQFLPKWLQDLIAEAGATAALEATYWLTEAYIEQRFLDEIRGISDASGVEYMELIRIHMLPELIQASCSMFGAWGPATKNTNESLIQLRALDWATDGPFQQYPVLFVYHPTTEGHNFTILSWAGFIGTITGFSSSPIGLCEKVWLQYNGSRPRSGIPWHFLTRDILQFDNTIDDAISRINNAQRTCSVWLGLGDPVNKFRAVGYAHDYVDVYDDNNYPVYPAHPRMDGLVYIDKHEQPSNNPCFSSLLQKYYGSITPEVTVQYITAIEQTGDMHIAIYDFANNHIFVSNASPFVNGTFTPAYDRPFVRLDTKALFNLKN